MSHHPCPVSTCRRLIPFSKWICESDGRKIPAGLRRAVEAALEAYKNLPQSASVERRAARREALRDAQDAAIAAVEAKISRAGQVRSEAP